jgi:hypothetical protein
MVQLLEVVLIEVREKSTGTDRMRRNVEVVNVPVPVFPDLGSGDSARR